MYKSNDSPIAKEALDRIGALFDIERLIAGSPAERRRSVRQRMAKPRIDELGVWLDAQLQKIPGKSDLAGAIRYARWPVAANHRSYRRSTGPDQSVYHGVRARIREPDCRNHGDG